MNKRNIAFLADRFRHYIVLGLALVFTIGMSSCEPDETSPEDEERLDGNWVCNETSENGSQNYQVKIERDQTEKNKYYIYNFHNLGFGGALGGGGEAYFTLSGNSINMPQQTVLEESGASSTANGSGALDDDKESITLNYDFDDGSGILLEVQATYTKQ